MSGFTYTISRLEKATFRKNRQLNKKEFEFKNILDQNEKLIIVLIIKKLVL